MLRLGLRRVVLGSPGQCRLVPLRFRLGPKAVFAPSFTCSRLHCRKALGAHSRKYQATVPQGSPEPCHASPAAREMRPQRTHRRLTIRTYTVLRRTIPVPCCIKTCCAPCRQPGRVNRREAPCHGASAEILRNWHSLCVKPCHRINVDPSRVQQQSTRRSTGQDNGVPRIQSSTGFAGRRFYFRNRFRAAANRQRFEPSTLRNPRS